MPDKWEYPWFAAWDNRPSSMIPMAQVDPEYAKSQLLHPPARSGTCTPTARCRAYEFAFSDVNSLTVPRLGRLTTVYKATMDADGKGDLDFLERAFQKLLLNFTWWVNHNDSDGRNLFGGGFLGLDNIGVFDRSTPLPDGVSLNQADGTAWMGLYCSTHAHHRARARADPVRL